MSSIKLGWEPHRIKPIFSRGVDWIVSIEPDEGVESPVWPDGTTVVAAVYDPSTKTSLPLDEWPELYSWPGEIVGDTLLLKVEAEEADQVPAGALMRIRVSYPGSGPERDDYLYAKGVVVRDD